MHWDSVIFYAEPKDLIFGGSAIIGAAGVEVDECVVAIKDLKHTEMGVSELLRLADLVRQGVKPRTAYPPMFMDAVSYFLARLGLPRHVYKVVAADPRSTPFKAFNVEGIVRNIAYLHGILSIVAREWRSMNTPKPSYAIHAMLRASGYNADEEYARRHRGPIPCTIKLL